MGLPPCLPTRVIIVLSLMGHGHTSSQRPSTIGAIVRCTALLSLLRKLQIFQQNTETSKLLQIPRELRDIIYNFVLQDSGTAVEIKQHLDSPPHRPSFLPPPSNTCHYICFEALPCYIRSCMFVIRSFPGLQWLHKLLDALPDEEGYSAIRSLSFINFH